MPFYICVHCHCMSLLILKSCMFTWFFIKINQLKKMFYPKQKMGMCNIDSKGVFSQKIAFAIGVIVVFFLTIRYLVYGGYPLLAALALASTFTVINWYQFRNVFCVAKALNLKPKNSKQQPQTNTDKINAHKYVAVTIILRSILMAGIFSLVIWLIGLLVK